MNEDVLVTIDNQVYKVPKGITLLELSKPFTKNYKFPILVSYLNNVLTELNHTIEEDCTVKFIDCTDPTGSRIYQQGLVFILLYAIKNLYGVSADIEVMHSIDRSLKIKTNFDITEKMVNDIKAKMNEVKDMNLSIIKTVVKRSDGIKYFKSINDDVKARTLRYNTNSYINLYRLGNLYNYFYSSMPVNTSVFTSFDLKFFGKNYLLLQYPVIYLDGEIPEYTHHKKIVSMFSGYTGYLERINVSTSADINEIVSKGKISDIIKLDEVIANNRLLSIAKNIANSKHKIKIVLIAGPSSSGKTTTSKKLSMFLRTFGLNPKPLSIDDYFKNRIDTPKLEEGSYDFESIDAINIELFNNHLNELLEGKEVILPKYDFIKGKSMISDKVIKLEENDILIIEGLHGLNEELTKQVPRQMKYKIYVAELTDVNIDKQNRVSTTDVRLLRRIIRDARTRGYTALETIMNWSNVREGEEKYVFPYQDEADCIFNSALVYEIGVLRLYAEPLLYAIDNSSIYYEEARRLLNFLRMFLTIPTDAIPADSILREFIGDSYFEKGE